jgi:hypothetical protein
MTLLDSSFLCETQGSMITELNPNDSNALLNPCFPIYNYTISDILVNMCHNNYTGNTCVLQIH